MNLSKPAKIFSIAVLLCFLASYSAYAGSIFWVDRQGDRIQSANSDGTNVQNIVTGLVDPTTLQIDSANEHLYWADNGPIGGSSAIMRSNLDGSLAQTIVSTGYPAGLFDFAIDTSNQYLFYTQLKFDGGTIYRTDLNGGSQTTVLNLNSSSPLWPGALALDSSQQQFYYIDKTALGNSQIKRANYDGAGSSLIYDGPGTDMFGALAYDPLNNILYFTDITGKDIEMIDLDTNTHSKIMDTTVGAKSLIIDGNFFYYGSSGISSGSGVYRANLDGTNETLFNLTSGQVLGVAALNTPEPGTFLLLGTGLLGFLFRRKK